MNVSAFLYSLASIPMFAARPFLAAAMTVLLAKFGTHVPWLGDSPVVIALSKAPEWFTSWPVVIGFVALAVTEGFAVKHAEVRAFLDEFDGYVKTAVSLLVALALLDKQDVETIRALQAPVQRAELGFQSLLAIVVAVLTYGAAGLRREALEVIADVDDDDDIGLQSLLNWVENSWTVLGLFFLVVFPIAALVLSALTTLGLWQMRRWAERREQRSKILCSACSTPVFPHATRCHACRTEIANPRGVSVFGTPKDGPAPDLVRHRFDLIARKRCPECATRLRQRAVQQACSTCRTVTFASRAEFQDYLDALRNRLPKTLLICLGLSAIPVIGVIPGVVYYRLTLVSGLRGYVPPLRSFFARVTVRIINWGLILLQPIPVLGALIVPLMCLGTYLIYRSTLNGRAEKDMAAAGSLEAA